MEGKMKILSILLLISLFIMPLFSEDLKSDYSIFNDKEVTIYFTPQDGGQKMDSISGTITKILDSGLLIESNRKNILIRYYYIVYIEEN